MANIFLKSTTPLFEPTYMPPPPAAGIEVTPSLNIASIETSSPLTIPDNHTVPFTPIYPDPEKCNYYILNHNTTEYFQFSNPYGGIPQNLLINVSGWLFLIILFGILRRAAGNYGRLAIIRREDDESRWTHVFFSTTDDEGQVIENTLEQGGLDQSESESLTSATDWADVDRGICSWITSIFTITDDMILRKCGHDALQYINFQRHMVIFVLIITFICMAFILPINFTMGNIQGDKTNFGHTTISNLAADAEVLWVHIVLSILFIPLGIYIMRRFSVTLRMEGGDNCISSRTLMFDLIPEKFCKKDLIIRHFQEAYDTVIPGFELEDVQIAYFVAKLTSLTAKLDKARKAVNYCENYLSKKGERLMMNDHSCGIVYGCCTCGAANKLDALEYYQQRETSLRMQVEKEQTNLHKKSIGVAFVTFSNLQTAEAVKRDFQRKMLFLKASPQQSSLQKELRPDNWEVRFAPPPEDIYWENLNSGNYRIIKVWVLNSIMFLVLFFFTSPAYLINLLETLPFLNAKYIGEEVKVNLPSYITDFLPTLLLWTLSALLPVIVAYSDWWLGHWRRSLENLWIMRKVFGYLLFMVLILPSIGLTTVRGLVESGFKTRNNTAEINWECIFLPDNGAFFINYVTTSALIGTGLEIIRFPELFMYSFRLAFARSQAEIASVRKEILYEFPFGINYAWMLLIFALTVSYSVICPLITPFGLFYMLMKHATDRYNIYFAYKASKINKNIHGCAINCVMISLLIQQLILLFFNTVRGNATSGLLPPRGIFSITMFTIFSLLFLVQIFFHAFKGISPIQYIQKPTQLSLQPEEGSRVLPTSSRHNNKPQQFIPDVLRNVNINV